MAQRYRCKEETEMYDRNIPVCLNCDVGSSSSAQQEKPTEDAGVVNERRVPRMDSTER